MNAESRRSHPHMLFHVISAPPKVMAALGQTAAVRSVTVERQLMQWEDDPLSKVIVNTVAPLSILKQHRGLAASRCRHVVLLSISAMTTLLVAIGYNPGNILQKLQDPGEPLVGIPFLLQSLLLR